MAYYDHRHSRIDKTNILQVVRAVEGETQRLPLRGHTEAAVGGHAEAVVGRPHKGYHSWAIMRQPYRGLIEAALNRPSRGYQRRGATQRQPLEGQTESAVGNHTKVFVNGYASSYGDFKIEKSSCYFGRRK